MLACERRRDCLPTDLIHIRSGVAALKIPVNNCLDKSNCNNKFCVLFILSCLNLLTGQYYVIPTGQYYPIQTGTNDLPVKGEELFRISDWEIVNKMAIAYRNMILLYGDCHALGKRRDRRFASSVKEDSSERIGSTLNGAKVSLAFISYSLGETRTD